MFEQLFDGWIKAYWWMISLVVEAIEAIPLP